jgi:hypothetical protein
VYKNVTYKGLGEIKDLPIHTIIEEARPKVGNILGIFCHIELYKGVFQVLQVQGQWSEGLALLGATCEDQIA